LAFTYGILPAFNGYLEYATTTTINNPGTAHIYCANPTF